MEAIFHAPKRRPRVYEAYEAPLPVPFGSDSGSERAQIYKAEVINQHVIVRDSEHIQALYGRGYFGKGVLSRSRPTHSLSEQWEYIGDKCLPVISLEKYQKHVRWARSALLAQGLDQDVVDQVLSDLTHPIQPDLPKHGDDNLPEHGDNNLPEHGDDNLPEHGDNNLPEHGDDNLPEHGDDNLPEHGDNNLPEHGDDNLPEHGDDNLPEHGDDNLPEHGNDNLPEHSDAGSEENQEPVESQEPSSHQDHPMEDALTEGGDRDDSGPSQAKRPRRQGDPQYDPLAELYPEEPERLDPNVLARIKCRRHDDWIVHCGCRVDDNEVVLGGSVSRSQACAASIAHGYVLVEEPDEDDGESDQNDRKCRVVCRINPFNMLEYLQLGYEEAFFLLFALGCLTVDFDGKTLSILQVWELFRSAQPTFDVTYAAYHFFRSKGWVPKSGIKYGSDFVLYWKGPPFYHASYSVVVERVNESGQGARLRPFTWRSLAALSRTTANVSKELMLCYVIVPADLQTLSSPELLGHLKVQTVIVSRWISSRERAEQEDI